MLDKPDAAPRVHIDPAGVDAEGEVGEGTATVPVSIAGSDPNPDVCSKVRLILNAAWCLTLRFSDATTVVGRQPRGGYPRLVKDDHRLCGTASQNERGANGNKTKHELTFS